MHMLYVVVCMTSRPAKPVAAAPSPLSALDRQPAATKQTAYPTEICSGWTTGPEDPAGVLLPCPALINPDLHTEMCLTLGTDLEGAATIAAAIKTHVNPFHVCQSAQRASQVALASMASPCKEAAA